MTTYFEYKVRLFDGQKEKLADAIENSSPGHIEAFKK